MKSPLILLLIIFICSCGQRKQSSNLSFQVSENVSIYSKTIAIAYNIDEAADKNELREKIEKNVLKRSKGNLYNGSGQIYIKKYTILIDSLKRVKEVISYEDAEQVLVSTASILTDVQYELPKVNDSFPMTYISKRQAVLESSNRQYPIFYDWKEQKCLFSEIDSRTAADGGKIVAIYTYK